jgi:hypothetical protein
MTVRTCLERLKAINDMIGNHRTGDGPHRPDEMMEYRGYIDGMVRLCQKAQAEGRPDVASHARQLVEQRRQARTTMFVPNPAFSF